jgi:hypothetical protein
VSRMGNTKNVCRILLRQPPGERPLGRLRRCDKNITVGIREIRYESGT